jgi:invasion protein IalB
MKNLTERLVVGGVALLVGLLLGWMVRGVATFNSNAAVLASYEDWRVTCPAATVENGSCELSTDIVDKSQPNPVARVTLTKGPDGKQMIGFHMPLGVALEAGMGLTLGKDPVKVIPYRTCNAIGCIATAPYDEKMAAALKGATEAQIAFATLEGKPIGMPLSMKGYSNGLSAMNSAEAKRHSWFWRLWS